MKDYCTWFPEGWWSHCCAAHDKMYAEQIGKALADEYLLLCVASSGGALSWLIGGVMFAGVAILGRCYYRRAGRK